jgi:uncharacterized membrane protein
MRRSLIILATCLLLSLGGCGVSDFGLDSGAESSTTVHDPAQTDPTEARSCAEVPGACVTEDALTTIVTYLTLFAELCGALVIGVAVIRAVGTLLPTMFARGHDQGLYKESVRLQLGKSLALALEFELAADILKTAVAPTLPIIAQLAAIIVLRTLLNYFLERELRQVEERHAQQLQREQVPQPRL